MISTKISNRSRERVAAVPLPADKAILIFAGALLSLIALLLFLLKGEVGAQSSEGELASRSSVKDMVLVPEGEFVMGNEGAYANETPLHTVQLNSFYLDAHEVTNAQFAAFVKATGYVTQAEREGHCWAYFNGEKDWQYAAGTDWRHPQGPNSTIDDKMNQPVVCVIWDDASAYARWAGKRLPTEAEWEYAARAGSKGHFIARTDDAGGHHAQYSSQKSVIPASDSSPSAKSHGEASEHHSRVLNGGETPIEANVWEGLWPGHNEMSDGFYYAAPVESFAPNAWGFYDMLGNVWEWTGDWYDSTYYAASPASNPQGPTGGNNRVARGGSWFCSPNYCGAYSTHYRGASPPDHDFNNVGFRCAMDVPEGKK